MGAPRHSQETRDAVVAVYASGKSLSDTAAATGVPEPTTRAIVHRAGIMRSRSAASTNRIGAAVERAVVEAYQTGEHAADIAARFDICQDSVTNIARRTGLSVRSAGAQRGAIDEHYFDEIDTEEKAYWLGFIAADGCVTDQGYLVIGLSAVDALHLESLRASLKAENPVRIYEARKATKSIRGRLVVSGPKAEFSSCSPTLVAGLARHGVTPRKSLTAVAPELRADLMRHYWRGAFDGDGGVWRGSTSNPSAWGAGFVGSDAMAGQFRDFVRGHCGKIGGMRPHPTSAGISYFEVGGTFGAFCALDLLYGHSTVSLDRKRALYEDLSVIARDRRRFVTVNGVTLRLSEWARRCGVRSETIAKRIDAWGWAPEDAVSVPTSCGGSFAKRSRAA